MAQFLPSFLPSSRFQRRQDGVVTSSVLFQRIVVAVRLHRTFRRNRWIKNPIFESNLGKQFHRCRCRPAVTDGRRLILFGHKRFDGWSPACLNLGLNWLAQCSKIYTGWLRSKFQYKLQHRHKWSMWTPWVLNPWPCNPDIMALDHPYRNHISRTKHLSLNW